jgi:hypothetical protein
VRDEFQKKSKAARSRRFAGDHADSGHDLGSAPGKAPRRSPPAKPGAGEIERLKFYVGEWQYTEEYPKSPRYPNGSKNTGIYASKLGPGGNSLINTFIHRVRWAILQASW